MFVGHALLAFALAVIFAQWRDWPLERAFAFGIATGAFAALPDIDVLYAIVALNPAELVSGTTIRPGVFWGTASAAHRLMTHSLVVAALAGPAFGVWTLRSTGSGPFPERWRPDAILTALVALSALVAATAFTSGPVGGFVMAAFALAGLGIAEISRSYLDLSPRLVAVAAVAGIASHPWGDLVTGEPPALVYPFEASVLTDRVVLSADPTLHLLGAFALELAAVTLAFVVVARTVGFRPHRLVGHRALLGAVYGVGAVVMAPPTIHLSYEFVFSILAVGGVCGMIRRSPRGWYPLQRVADKLAGDLEATLRTIFTTLAGIAVALASYGVVYLLAS